MKKQAILCLTVMLAVASFFASQGVAATDGYVVSTNQNLILMNSDGTYNKHVNDVASFLTPLSNGNLAAYIGSYNWRVYDSSLNVVGTKTLDNMGTYTGATALSGGRYVVSTTQKVVLMNADGSYNSQVSDSCNYLVTLSNGTFAGYVGADNWRLYDSNLNTIYTKTLDNLGSFTGSARLGSGYVVSTNQNLILMNSDGTYNKHVNDVTSFLTPLSNGNLAAYIGNDNWRVYDNNLNVLGTRTLDNLGTWADATALSDGRFVISTTQKVILMNADGSFNSLVSDSGSFLTTLSDGDFAGYVGADNWRLYSGSDLSTIYTKTLDNLGTFTGSASFYAVPEPATMVLVGVGGMLALFRKKK